MKSYTPRIGKKKNLRNSLQCFRIRDSKILGHNPERKNLGSWRFFPSKLFKQVSEKQEFEHFWKIYMSLNLSDLFRNFYTTTALPDQIIQAGEWETRNRTFIKILHASQPLGSLSQFLYYYNLPRLNYSSRWVRKNKSNIFEKFTCLWTSRISFGISILLQLFPSKLFKQVSEKEEIEHFSKFYMSLNLWDLFRNFYTITTCPD